MDETDDQPLPRGLSTSESAERLARQLSSLRESHTKRTAALVGEGRGIGLLPLTDLEKKLNSIAAGRRQQTVYVQNSSTGAGQGQDFSIDSVDGDDEDEEDDETDPDDPSATVDTAESSASSAGQETAGNLPEQVFIGAGTRFASLHAPTVSTVTTARQRKHELFSSGELEDLMAASPSSDISHRRRALPTEDEELLATSPGSVDHQGRANSSATDAAEAKAAAAKTSRGPSVSASPRGLSSRATVATSSVASVASAIPQAASPKISQTVTATGVTETPGSPGSRVALRRLKRLDADVAQPTSPQSPAPRPRSSSTGSLHGPRQPPVSPSTTEALAPLAGVIGQYTTSSGVDKRFASPVFDDRAERPSHLTRDNAAVADHKDSITLDPEVAVLAAEAGEDVDAVAADEVDLNAELRAVERGVQHHRSAVAHTAPHHNPVQSPADKPPTASSPPRHKSTPLVGTLTHETHHQPDRRPRSRSRSPLRTVTPPAQRERSKPPSPQSSAASAGHPSPLATRPGVSFTPAPATHYVPVTVPVTVPIRDARQPEVERKLSWAALNRRLEQINFPTVMNAEGSAAVDPQRQKQHLISTFIQLIAEYQRRGQVIQYLVASGSEAEHEHDRVRKDQAVTGRQTTELHKQLTRAQLRATELEEQITTLKRSHANEMRQQVKRNDVLQLQLAQLRRTSRQKEMQLEQSKDRLQTELDKSQQKHDKSIEMFRRIHHRPPKLQKGSGAVKDRDMLAVIRMYEEDRNSRMKELAASEQEVRDLNALLAQKESLQVTGRHMEMGRAQPEQADASLPAHPEPAFVTVERMREQRAQKQLQHVREVFAEREKRHLTQLNETEDQLRAAQRTVASLEDELSDVRAEISQRPTPKQWHKAQLEISRLRRMLSDTKSLRELNKYVDTKELMRRDREVHRLRLRKLELLPREIAVEILQDCCRTLQLDDVALLLPSLEKLQKAVSAIPMMEEFIRQTATEVFSISQAVDRESLPPPRDTGDLLERIIPSLRKWKDRLQQLPRLSAFQKLVGEALSKRAAAASVIDTEVNAQHSNRPQNPEHLLMQVQELVDAEREVLETKDAFVGVEQHVQTHPELLSSRIIRHFQHLFKVKDVKGIFPKLNEVFLRIEEAKGALNTLRSLLGLDPRTPVNVCIEELTRCLENRPPLAAAAASSRRPRASGATERSRAPEFELTDPPPVSRAAQYFTTIKALKSLLRAKSPAAIVRRCKEILDRLRVYDSVLPRLDSLVTRLFALLSVEHMDEIVPELQRRLLVDTDVSRHELEEPHSHDMRRRNRSRSPRGRRTRDSPGRSSRQSEDSHCSTCSSSTHTETSPRKSSPSRSEDVYAHKPTGPSSSSSYPPSSADDGTDDKPAADTRGASGPWAGTVTESTYDSEPSVRHYRELSAAPL